MQFVLENLIEPSDVNDIEARIKAIYGNPQQRAALYFSSCMTLLGSHASIQPVYYRESFDLELNYKSRNECKKQISRVLHLLKKLLHKHSDANIRALSPKVDILNQNITKQIDKYEDYVEKYKVNVQLMCASGKRNLEEIYCHIKYGQLPSEKLFEILDNFLNCEQISECMGGVLTIIENTRMAFNCNISSIIRFACADRINYDALTYINRHKLLNMYFNGQRNQILANPAIINEVHFVAALRNAVAERFPFIGKNSDTYTDIFPKGNGWLEKFAEQYSHNKLLDYFTSRFINDLPDMPQTYDLDIYTHIVAKLDQLGTDADFGNQIYIDQDGELSLQPNYQIALRASIIKRLLSSGYLKIEPHESIYDAKIDGVQHKLYLLGAFNNYWLEITTRDGNVMTLRLNQLGIDQYQSILCQLNLDKHAWQQIILASSLQNNIELLQLGLFHANPNECYDVNGNTPLIIAVLAQAYEAMEILIADPRLDINATNNRGKTAIAAAACVNDLKAVTILLDTGADANIPNIKGYTPLSLAAKEGHNSCVEKLISDPLVIFNFLHTRTGRTPAMIAMENGQEETAMLIITHSRSVYGLVDNSDQNLMMYAIIHNLPQCFDFLINQSAIKRQANLMTCGYNYLMLAAKYNRAQFIGPLVEKLKLDINTVNDDGETALVIALRVQNVDAIRELMKFDHHNYLIKSRNGKTITELLELLKDQEISNILGTRMQLSEMSVAAYVSEAGETSANINRTSSRVSLCWIQ